LDAIPVIAPVWWVFGSAIIVILVLIEGSFKHSEKLEGERRAAESKADALREREVVARETQARELAETNRQNALSYTPTGAIIRAMQEKSDRAAKGLFAEPPPGSARLRDAPFIFPLDPDFDGDFPSAFVIDEFLAGSYTDGPSRHAEMKRNIAVPAFRLENGSDLIYCKVQWEKRAFKWQWEKIVTTDNLRHFSLEAYPTDFLAQNFSSTGTIGGNVMAQLLPRAGMAWGLMTDPIFTLIESGRLSVYARMDSPTGFFSKIAADSWRHFKVRDWHTGYAEAPTGHLYSIHIAKRG
jgi:hypothetical protein